MPQIQTRNLTLEMVKSGRTWDILQMESLLDLGMRQKEESRMNSCILARGTE